MENIKSHKNMKLATSQEKYTKYVMKPDFTDGYPFRKSFFAVEIKMKARGKSKIKMSKSMKIGEAALDLS